MSSPESQKVDYQKTLNLPQTDFSMRAGLAQREPAFIEKWEKEGLYTKIKEKSKGKPRFILHDGPPYANGNIHIGHALNKVLKDMVVKFKTMEGYNSWYVPGWDCHGLPIEHQLLKELKKKKSEVDCIDLRKKAHDYAMKYVGIQRDQFKRLGVFGDWEHPYLTLNTEYEYWILRSLGALNKKGYVYRGLKPVNWCYQCETALAEAEVEYEDHASPTVYVKFRVSDPQKLQVKINKPLDLLIWTTTPWTLVANVAVAVHGAFQYVLADIGTSIVVVEKSLSKPVLEKAGISDFKIIATVTGEDLTKLTYHHPLNNRSDCRVVAADYVTKEDGTGLVHTAPGHGQDDFETGQKYNLETVMPVNDHGVYTEEGGTYAGEHVFKANPKIIEELKNKGTLLHSENVSHSYPHCWRCKSPIIFRATQQWFLSIDHNNLRAQLKDAVDTKIQWVPESGKERILGMVTGRPDWCLSRQRYWGVPIPALKDKKTGKHKLFTEVIDCFADIVRKEGSNAWFEKDISKLIPAGFKDPETGSSDFEKTFDILDVWFDSGVSHQAVVKAMMGEELPIELYLEGSDQHRGWFQSSLIPAMAIEGKPPYSAVLTHGFVVDGQGRKMSKSLGNVISPLDIIKESGADIIRLWVASSSYNEDIRISKEILERLVDSYRKIRNTLRYLLGNLNGFDPDRSAVKYEDLLGIDQWALYKLAQTVRHVKEDYEHYEFAKVYKRIYAFCNTELSSFYLDILKDRLYTSAANSVERRAAQSVLYYILKYLVRLLAPVISFTAEEAFLAMPRDNRTKQASSVHLLEFEEVPKEWDDREIEKRFELLVQLRPFVLKSLEDFRNTGEIGSSLEAKVIFKTSSQRDLGFLKEFQGFLPDAFIVSQVEVEQVSSVKKPLGEEFAKTEIEILKADGQKCGRCWKYTLDVGKHKDHPAICARCTDIVKEYE